jgi:hypothetical protein
MFILNCLDVYIENIENIENVSVFIYFIITFHAVASETTSNQT